MIDLVNNVMDITEEPKKKRARRKLRGKHRLEYVYKHRLMIRRGSKCEECGSPARVVHHIVPVSVNPVQWNDENNLQVLCYACHRLKHEDLPDVLFRPITVKERTSQIDCCAT